jgi:hypothetical protein
MKMASRCRHTESFIFSCPTPDPRRPPKLSRAGGDRALYTKSPLPGQEKASVMVPVEVLVSLLVRVVVITNKKIPSPAGHDHDDAI